MIKESLLLLLLIFLISLMLVWFDVVKLETVNWAFRSFANFTVDAIIKIIGTVTNKPMINNTVVPT